MIRIWFLCCLFFVNIPASIGAETRTKIILACNDLPIYRQLSFEIIKILNQHSERIEFIQANFPPKRIVPAISQKQANGSLIRPISPDPENQFSTLIRVPTPLIKMASRLVIHKDSPDITERSQLEKMKVGLVSGSMHSTIMVPKPSRILINSVSSGIKMVQSKRIDAMSSLDIGYFAALAEHSADSFNVRLASFQLPVDFYIFLNITLQNLVPEVDLVLKKVQETNEIQIRYEQMMEDSKKNPDIHKG